MTTKTVQYNVTRALKKALHDDTVNGTGQFLTSRGILLGYFA